MARLKLTVGFSPNPRIAPLIDGAVKPQNIELDFVVSHPGQIGAFDTNPEHEHGN